MISSYWQKARQSRDHRFDGLFYVAVKSTGIYCRPICPAPTALEKNVVYYEFAHNAAQDGFRPCIRCRPDSAPGSAAWQGTKTTALRAKQLIDQHNEHDCEMLAERLGVSSRYLRRLFKQNFGLSVTQYRIFNQCHFAKKLIQETNLPLTEIAFSAGFKSTRRFNDAFLKQLNIAPSTLRKTTNVKRSTLELILPFRPPYNWLALRSFIEKRLIKPVEWVSENSYGRTFSNALYKGSFTAEFIEDKHHFKVKIDIDNTQYLQSVINNIRRVLDLDADVNLIETHLSKNINDAFPLCIGLRLPGIWSDFEAGIRAVLGQQVSVAAAHNLVTKLVAELGENDLKHAYFPSAEQVAQSNFDFFKMPQTRKNALHNLALFCNNNPGNSDLDLWLDLKGIGPWTVNYAKLRGQSQPDVLLEGDLGINKAQAAANSFNSEKCTPFRSYLTFQLWQQLS
ncbi:MULTISPECIES: AlkA N-terminal domain-containing protein [unclassified Pseudoalteromonas]|uniref:DNA-3-methyladenine glycosylase 2 family protein n=1 Tax=unclassified Pseudoalteromonas TaxID=194690 RepID=UPI001107B161|nr:MULTISPECIES: AlkA N-terminal domain-containing protein [unclassified Pseudoalteromonas]TMN83292.1 transcriptional regulator [Pseudoalteromonas sp. S410]TMN90014.1 transcriptional regulator [Pseudoalteromonas sp. S408]TMN96883.1 transcriptional regulator [Pseudoalteromonas sp. S409]TMN96994.1 transcriptional regulator [Pseudoalteromonas sp. S407]TMO12350.1 transcriptional regulator [Pseudoalteromonas sp. S186]